jgi:hypothetical protein
MSNDNQDKVPQIVESLSDETKDEIDPMVKVIITACIAFVHRLDNAQSDMEARMKYGGLRPKVKAVAQRKISQGVS